MHKRVNEDDVSIDSHITPTYSSRLLRQSLPKYRLPEHETDPDTVYQTVKDELLLDGNAHMNLATFVTTWMEPQATKLMSETFEKNLVDRDEYPQTAEIENRCVNILANLWNAPKYSQVIGTSTVGSSEGCMLAGMAMKRNWQKRTSSDKKPNLVIGANAQVCWDKFCRYWEVDIRFVSLKENEYHLNPKRAIELCDENTIGVVGILGSTLDGSFEPIEELCKELDSLQDRTGINIPVHVDAASGGFVAPFLRPELVWDFRLFRVKSINSSGHKYGMVYPGVGWVLWRHPDDLPEELIFKVNYLGGLAPTFSINFSRPGNGVIAQYYNFLRLGREGYRKILEGCQETARYLSSEIEKLGHFTLLSDGSDLPVFSFRLKDEIKTYTLFDLSTRLKEKGWQVPVYTMPEDIKEMTVMRIVVKENFSKDMADLLLNDFKKQVQLMNVEQHRFNESESLPFHH